LDSSVKLWERPFVQLFSGFLLLGLFAWWTFQAVSLPPVLRDLFEQDSAIATAAIPPTEEERFQRELSRLPAPPENHAPEVAELLSSLRELQTVPPAVMLAVKRDRDTPENQVPAAWSDAERQSLRDYQARFWQAWELFLSRPAPDWERFPDSATFFRSLYPPMANQYKDLLCYGFYEPEQPKTWGHQLESQPEFYLRLFRQSTTIGTLRFGTLSGWAVTDVTSSAKYSEETIRKSDYFFFDSTLDPRSLLPLSPLPPTISTLRAGLRTDRAVFLRSAEYLQSLPMDTPAQAALTRLLGNQGDAEWFIRKVNHPKTARELATILQQGADEIGALEQKTFFSGPAWRQWLAGDLGTGLKPVIAGALTGIQEFEETALKYQVALAFLNAASAFRESGVEGMRNIPDPARPGFSLTVMESTNGITLSSAFQDKTGENYRFTFQPVATP
jgi:hypothetical protein